MNDGFSKVGVCDYILWIFTYIIIIQGHKGKTIADNVIFFKQDKYKYITLIPIPINDQDYIQNS